MNTRSVSRNFPHEGRGFVPIFHDEFDSTLKSLSHGALAYYVWMQRFFWRPKNEADRHAHKHWREGHTAYFRQHAADELHCSVSTISRRNTELVKAGIIEGKVTGRVKQFCRKRHSVENSVEKETNDSTENAEMRRRYKEEKNVLKGFTSDNRNISRCGNVEKERGNPGRGFQPIPDMPSPKAPATKNPSERSESHHEDQIAAFLKHRDLEPGHRSLSLKEKLAHNRALGKDAAVDAALAKLGFAAGPKGGLQKAVVKAPRPADSSKSVSPPSET